MENTDQRPYVDGDRHLSQPCTGGAYLRHITLLEFHSFKIQNLQGACFGETVDESFQAPRKVRLAVAYSRETLDGRVGYRPYDPVHEMAVLLFLVRRVADGERAQRLQRRHRRGDLELLFSTVLCQETRMEKQ